MEKIKKHATLIVILISIAVLAVSMVVSWQESTTMDEQAHIPSGYTYVKYNDMRLNQEHPPLLKDLAGFPLLFMNLNFPTDDYAWTNGINEQWTLGNKFIHSNNAELVTFWSRFPIILVSLLLGFFIYKWTKEVSGTLAGLFALVLYAADPNILGHNHYVTTDIGIAAFIFIAFYFFIKFLKNPNWKNVVLAGIFLGLAELAKFSAVLLFPIFGMVIFVYSLAKTKPSFDTRSDLKFKWATFWEYAGKYVVIVSVCFVLIWVLYLYNTFNMPPEKIQDVAKTVFGDQGSGKIAKAIVIQMSTMPVVKYLAEYFLGVFMVFVRVTGGNTYYFMGAVSNHASPAYFPVVFLLKETFPFLVILLFTSIYAIATAVKKIFAMQENVLKGSWKILREYLEKGVVQWSMLIFIFIYSYLSVTGNLNIGFRHLFPILPFVYFLVAKKIFDFLRNNHYGKIGKGFSVSVLVLLAWIVLEPIVSFPSYISYFNEAAGGPKNGYKYVTDSNTDWGQDLKRLKNWVDEYNQTVTINKIGKIRIDYFGGSNPNYYFGENFIPWHADNDPEPGWYAISAGFLQESIYKQKNPGDKSYEWLKNKEPFARVGNSIFVYYIQ